MVNRVVLWKLSGRSAQLAEESPRAAPLAVQAAKRMVNQAFERTLAEGLAEEKQVFYNLFAQRIKRKG
jgi:enoyl-CoA hydratase/carnithine racemase